MLLYNEIIGQTNGTYNNLIINDYNIPVVLENIKNIARIIILNIRNIFKEDIRSLFNDLSNALIVMHIN